MGGNVHSLHHSPRLPLLVGKTNADGRLPLLVGKTNADGIFIRSIGLRNTLYYKLLLVYLIIL